MKVTLTVALLGMMGIFCRFGVDRAAANLGYDSYKATFLINLLGCFLAGFLIALSERNIFSEALHIGLLVGFCGGFTTFSAYAIQSLDLFDRSKTLAGILYFTTSPLAGLLAAYVSLSLARRILA